MKPIARSILPLGLIVVIVTGHVRADDECCRDQTPQDVLAKVNDRVIRRQEIDKRIEPLLRELAGKLGQARRQQLDLLINGRLLEGEARRRSTTATKLLKAEVLAHVTAPTEAEALAFFNEQQDQFAGEFKLWAGKIRQYLTQRRQAEAAKSLADRLREPAEVTIYATDAELSDVDAAANHILATVDGHTITLGDIDRDLTTAVAMVRQHRYERRLQALNASIDSLLIQQEAVSRKLTVDALLQAEVTPNIEPVTEKDILQFYAENQSQLAADITRPQDRQAIGRYLTTVRTRDAQAAFAQRLRPRAALEMFLAEPAKPVYEIATDDQPTLGAADAPVTIVVFADFECRRCARLHETLRSLSDEYGQDLKVVARDFPLSQHPRAMQAAIAAEAARAQGKYWDFAKLLYTNQTALEPEDLQRYAGELGMDVATFTAALDSAATAGHVRRDVHDGRRLGLRSTPFVFVNGRPLDDKSRESLQATIEQSK